MKVKKRFVPIKAIYSASNTLYTNVANTLQVCYPDSASAGYSLTADYTFIQKLKEGEFTLTKHTPGQIIVNIYKTKPSGATFLYSALQFDVKPLPQGSLTIGGKLIDSDVSRFDLIAYDTLGIAFGDFYPGIYWCYVDSFDLKIDDKLYHSSSNRLTLLMLQAVLKTKSPITFQNVKVSINSADDVDAEVNEKGERKIIQRSYWLYRQDKDAKTVALSD